MTFPPARRRPLTTTPLVTALEERLLGSIAERGIKEPLEGVEVGAKRILLNGFKRYRCARKLRIDAVPYASLGQDEAAGIIGLLRIANDKALALLEQAAFIILAVAALSRVGKKRAGRCGTPASARLTSRPSGAAR